ncbi:hypothetical protein BDV59DRAFT_204998 [Aspergillus ambiguus]|uniref:uncharacterized protein n=1 Tax=Aspergillus ambiguus TaxID=176160 RepID=UPI003CCC9073
MSAITSTTAPTAAPPVVPPREINVQPRRQWGKIVVSAALGGIVAVVLAPTIAAAAPVGATWLIASNMTAGIVGSVTTRMARNAIGADVTEVEYNPHRARLRFRSAIINHFDVYLDPIIDCIRSNAAGSFHETTALTLTGSLSFLAQLLQQNVQETSDVYLRYNYQVVPRRNSPSRPVDEGVPPLDLPVHHQDAVATLRLNEPEGVLDGIGGAVVRGAIFGGGIGLIGQALGQTGPLFERMFVLDTAPGMNMVFASESASAAADPLVNLIPGPSSEERAAYLIELVAEIQLHINRVSQCAINNGVGLIYQVELGIRHEFAGSNTVASGDNRNTVWNRWEATVGV